VLTSVSHNATVRTGGGGITIANQHRPFCEVGGFQDVTHCRSALVAKRKKQPSSSLSGFLPAAVMAIAVGLAVGVWFVWPEPEAVSPTGTTGDVASAGSATAGPSANPPTVPPGQTVAGPPSGKPYRPGESDRELSSFLERLRAEQGDAAEAQLTEQQIIDIMGPPTRSEPPITGRKNGQVFTLKELRWEHHTPAKDYSTVVSIVNGRFAGGVIGLEVTPLQASAPFSPPAQTSPAESRATSQPTPPKGPLGEWVVGIWEGKLPATIGIPPRTLRVEFRKSGELVVLSEPRAPDNFEATWRVERTEGNNLWILFDVTRVNGQPAQNPGRSILIVRHDEEKFTSRAFQPPDEAEFRRVPSGR